MYTEKQLCWISSALVNSAVVKLNLLHSITMLLKLIRELLKQTPAHVVLIARVWDLITLLLNQDDPFQSRRCWPTPLIQYNCFSVEGAVKLRLTNEWGIFGNSTRDLFRLTDFWVKQKCLRTVQKLKLSKFSLYYQELIWKNIKKDPFFHKVYTVFIPQNHDCSWHNKKV